MCTVRIYPQSIEGKYRTRRNFFALLLLFVYFASSWLRWDRGEGLPSQALLIDLAGRKAYFFGIELWPDEIYYITLLLIMGALGLLFVASLFGRLWCGYTCPHTVFTDLFLKVENMIQGDRNQHMRLDQAGFSLDKLIKKLLTHTCWFAIGFSFAVGWVSYFYDAPSLYRDILFGDVSGVASKWLIGLTFSTWLFAGFIRQRVCIYMCPYGRFQSAMMDMDTLSVSYIEERGEPRGKETAGDCIDCSKCVNVCPMGIDIRDGFQIACIGCGLCVDACDSVMLKIGKPPGLIQYASVNDIESNFTSRHKRVTTRTVLFGALFLASFCIILYSLSHRNILNFSVSRDRSALSTLLPDGDIRNTFSISLINKSDHAMDLVLSISGTEGAMIKYEKNTEYDDLFRFKLGRGKMKKIKVFVKVPKEKSALLQAQGITKVPISIDLNDETNDDSFSYATDFILTEKHVK